LAESEGAYRGCPAALQTGEAELTATILDIELRCGWPNRRVIAERRLVIPDELRQSAARAADAAQAL
jgi:hypothetical protein